MEKVSDFSSLTDASWRKASYSNSQGACVEIAESRGSVVINGRIFVRDSKNPQGAVLQFTEKEWRAFISGAKDGEFDLESISG